ncbi:MAG: hypothetical protein M0D57_06170 [Sphingobacteriales bacterium JAD_PAG50586_3]|nr:MAG: hypothetical protein M0D57_06170 [Sphingobacteriales bacterium JAD_PAG50586_3]
MRTRLYTCLMLCVLAVPLVSAQSKYPSPYQSVGLYYAHDFKVAENRVREQSVYHIGLAYQIKPARTIILEFCGGINRFKYNFFKEDILPLPVPGPADYDYYKYGIEGQFNLKFDVLYATRGDKYYKIYPLLGLGSSAAFYQSKQLKDKGDRKELTKLNSPKDYFNYSLKSGLEVAFNDCWVRRYVIAIGCFYQFNSFPNTAIEGNNHNVQIQVRTALNFEKKPRKIALE